MAASNDGLTYTTTDNIVTRTHPQVQWARRFPDDDRRVDDAWRDAQPVESGSAPVTSAIYTRVLGESGALLLAHGDVLLTAMYVALEPAHERRRWMAEVDGLTPQVIHEQHQRISRGELPDYRDEEEDEATKIATQEPSTAKEVAPDGGEET